MDFEVTKEALMLSYKYLIPHPMPQSMVTKIFLHFARIKTPVLISDKELIIQESPACLHLAFNDEVTLSKGLYFLIIELSFR